MNNSNCSILDSDFSDELVINEKTEECKRISYLSSDEEEEYIFHKPTAPPPSPQEPSMLNMIFEENSKPTSVFKEKKGLAEHAQALDKLLRKTLNQQQNSSKICKKRRTSWTTLDKHQKLKSIVKAATRNADKLKKSLIIDEETSLVIHELREMGL